MAIEFVFEKAYAQAKPINPVIKNTTTIGTTLPNNPKENQWYIPKQMADKRIAFLSPNLFIAMYNSAPLKINSSNKTELKFQRRDPAI